MSADTPATVSNETVSQKEEIPSGQAATTDSTHPAYDADVAKAFELLGKHLADVTRKRTATVNAKRDAQIKALKALDSDPLIDEMILRVERERELDTLNARDEAAYGLRAAFATQFAALDLFGKPKAAPVTGKPGKPAKQNGNKELRDKDGVLYRAIQHNAEGYRPTGDRPCGACRVSEIVENAGAVALPNFRQNSTRALEGMTGEEFNAHAKCFNALRDAEVANYPQAASVREFARA